jgi:hypothetical protein
MMYRRLLLANWQNTRAAASFGALPHKILRSYTQQARES